MQYPKVPKLMVASRAELVCCTYTLRMAMLLTTGAEMVVMRSRMAEMRIRVVPILR